MIGDPILMMCPLTLFFKLSLRGLQPVAISTLLFITGLFYKVMHQQEHEDAAHRVAYPYI